MFCYQCEQTYRGNGCTDLGVCGKDDTTATLQDLLVYAAKGIAMYAHRARQGGASDPAIDTFVAIRLRNKKKKTRKKKKKKKKKKK